MTVDLFDVVGIDAQSPEAVRARQDSEDYERLIRCLLDARLASGRTQTDIAHAMGTGQSAVSSFERLGADPRYSTIQRYARAVGVRVRAVVVADGWRAERQLVIRTTAAQVLPNAAEQVTQTQLPLISVGA